MAVIKCSNCENEILDTEIVCPYCDCPVNMSKENTKHSLSDEAALRGETVKVSPGKVIKPENSVQNIKPEESEKVSVPEEESKSDSVENPGVADETRESKNEVSEPESEPLKSDDSMGETRKYTRTPEMSRNGGGSGKSVQTRKKKKKKKKESKWMILGITIVGIVIIIFLVINVFSRIFGEGLFDPEKESKKAGDFVESSAEEVETGFEFNSHTLTITDESIAGENYEPNSEKPWKEHISKINNLTIANGIEIIGTHVFDDIHGLKHVTLAATVSNIGSSAFYGCSKLEEVVVDSDKSKLRSIGDNAFTDCSSLKRITLGNQLRRIGSGAFKSCDSLTRIEIPDTTTEIGEEAFLGCTNLTVVCSKDSYAYEYAIENGLTVELVEDENAPETEPEPETAPISGDNSDSGTTASSSTTKKDGTKKNGTTDKSSSSGKADSGTESKGEASSTSGKTSDNQDKGQSNSGQNSQTNDGGSSNDSVQQELSNLQTQLKNAQTQEEKDKILQEIISISQ